MKIKKIISAVILSSIILSLTNSISMTNVLAAEQDSITTINEMVKSV